MDTGLLSERRLEWTIGVVYLPKTERLSHYFYAPLPAQFDVVLHFVQTQAVELIGAQTWRDQETRETVLTGI